MTTITDPKVYPEDWDYGTDEDYGADEDEGWKDNDWEDEDDGDPCTHCGPWCPEWGGDGLCNLEIQAQANEEQEYHDRFVTENFTCPVCKQ